MTAVIAQQGAQQSILSGLDSVLLDLGRCTTDVLHWINVKKHAQRKYLAGWIAQQDVHVVSVVVSKWHLSKPIGLANSDTLYNWTLRLLSYDQMLWMRS